LAPRLVLGGLLLLPLLILTVGLPAYVLGQLGGHGATSSISLMQTTIGGVAISFLSAAVFILRPTRGYGPSVMARAAVTSVYFLTLAGNALVSVPLPGGPTIGVSYGTLLDWLALIPAFSLVGGALVTFSDQGDLAARLRRDFPERRGLL
jgi:hypothetical protein